MDQKNKSASSSLTNTFTFEEIIEIFTRIDKKIISLHQCSSDDFLGLNKQFKEFHSESRTISENAQKVLDVITQDKTLEALRNLQILKEQLKSQIRQVEIFLANTGNLIYATISGIEGILFLLRSLRQNLTTIKFLITNKKLESSYNNPTGTDTGAAIDSAYSSTENVIKKIHDIEYIFIAIKKILVENQDKISELSDENSYALGKSFQSITKKINKLVDIRQSALQAIPRLKKITEECRENVSQIITNLQYHDIIKQRIDHIQITHRNLVAELGNIKINSEELPMKHNHAKFFLKTRDIAGLQAAQLIHANKAYENAIREITNSLKGTGQSMAEISQLCNQFVSKPELFDILHERDLQLQLENLSEQVNHDKDHIEELSGSITMALQSMKTIEKDQPLLEKSTGTLISDITAIMKIFDEISEDRNELTQINTLLRESDNLITSIGEKTKEEYKNLFSVHKTQSSFIAGRSGYLNKLYSTTDDLLSARGQSIAKQLSTLQENIRDGSNITNSIRQSIDQVKYYDYFETVIEEVISELNSINYKLKYTGEDDLPGAKDQNLAHLKDHYTMESEHKIHESYSVSNAVNQDNNSIAANEEKSEDEDNLELF